MRVIGRNKTPLIIHSQDIPMLIAQLSYHPFQMSVFYLIPGFVMLHVEAVLTSNFASYYSTTEIKVSTSALSPS